MPNGTFDDDQAEARATARARDEALAAEVGADPRVVDDHDAPSPIDSDQPASLHGARCTPEEGRAAVDRLQRAGAALAGFPWDGSTTALGKP
jgi:hypothetical protein